jgi:hypothetical protein
LLEGFGDVGMAAIAVGGIEEAEAVVVAIEQETRQSIDAESGLMGMMAGADCAGAHGKAAGLDAGFADSNDVGSAKFARKRFEGGGVGPLGKRGRMEPGGSRGAGGAKEKFAAFHGPPQIRNVLREDGTPNMDGWVRAAVIKNWCDAI